MAWHATMQLCVAVSACLLSRLTASSFRHTMQQLSVVLHSTNSSEYRDSQQWWALQPAKDDESPFGARKGRGLQVSGERGSAGCE